MRWIFDRTVIYLRSCAALAFPGCRQSCRAERLLARRCCAPANSFVSTPRHPHQKPYGRHRLRRRSGDGVQAPPLLPRRPPSLPREYLLSRPPPPLPPDCMILRFPIWTTARRRAQLSVDGSCLSVIALSAVTLSRTYLVMPASPKSGMMCFSYAILNNKMMN